MMLRGTTLFIVKNFLTASLGSGGPRNIVPRHSGPCRFLKKYLNVKVPFFERYNSTFSKICKDPDTCCAGPECRGTIFLGPPEPRLAVNFFYDE